jgi:hypothetical protein
LFDDLRAEFDSDTALLALKEVIQGLHGDKWRVIDNLIMVNGCVYIPTDSPTKQVALAATHGAGHEGIQTILHHL